VALLLQATEVTGPLSWRWLLREEASGALLADHQVCLDPAAEETVRFADLYGYVRWHAAPDRRVCDESRIVAQAGEWARGVLLGEAVTAATIAAAPVTVRVSLPPELDPVLLWPLELPLAGRGDVTFVYGIAPAAGGAKAAVSGALRVLAVFSQPTETSVLALRRERYELTRLIRRIAARQRAAVELKVVQYGVTRELLAEIAGSGDGWDVLHLSGHGGRGVFLLEQADGSPDPVGTAALVRLLRPMRRRVKLAVVSACESAAEVTAETLRLIGLADQAEQVESAGRAEAAAAPSGMARALVADLDCAVVAMRYPVVDDFAVAFSDRLYRHLLVQGNALDVAVPRALADAAGPAASAALSLATPGVFGTRACGLVLAAPRDSPELDLAEVQLPHFPREPVRFVGRAAAMAPASMALAPGSGRTGVLLHGMAGAGKTACALELAYRHRDSFAAAAFWQAPTRDEEWAGALASLAIALEVQLPGFTMTGHLSVLEAFLPRLRRLLETSGVLLVLDNLETLLTPSGTWRDPRWGPLVEALSGHDGESRLVLTSRIPPAGLGPGVLVRPLHALSLGEAIALTRELPNLRALLHADAGPVRTGTDQETDAAVGRDRARVRRVLHVVQGHPKLLELADAAASDRDRLDAQLAAAEAAATGQGLDAFFHDGTSTLDPDQFLAALAGWTASVLAVLAPAVRLMAQFVACLEDADRRSGVIGATWAGLWHRLEQPGGPPDPVPLLDSLAAAALIQPDSSPLAGGDTEQPGASAAPPAGSGAEALIGYRMHPGVAAAIGAAAAPEVGAAADAELGAFWHDVAYQAQEREGGEDSALIVAAGLAAVPYLLRRSDWRTASILLDLAVIRDGSPGVVQAVLPALRRIAAATGAPVDSFTLGRVLRTVDRAEAEMLLRGALGAAAGAGDDRLASAIAGELVNLLRDAGRLAEALDLAGQKAAYTRRAGLGPWTQLLDEGQRLQVLGQMGEHERVLAETGGLRTRMGELPGRPAGNENARPWNARELILDTGHGSALALERWQQCLDLNAEILASQRQRGAGVHELTSTRFNDAWPLIRLGRLAEAGELLRACQQVFEDHRDTTMLARVLSTRASLEDELGHRDAAVDFEQTAIRLRYARPGPRDIAISHHNLAYYLRMAGGDPAVQRAHRLAAALIYRLAGMAHDLADTLRVLAAEFRAAPAAGAGPGAGQLPATLAEVIRVAGQTDGVHLGDLIAALEPDPQAAEGALAEILRAAADPEH
jgi:tetratricopeptide (TPR) repeat protein